MTEEYEMMVNENFGRNSIKIYKEDKKKKLLETSMKGKKHRLMGQR